MLKYVKNCCNSMWKVRLMEKYPLIVSDTIPSLTIQVYLHSFSCGCLPKSQNHPKFRQNLTLHWRLRSSKVIDLGVNRKPMYDFLLVTNSNFGRYLLPFSRYWRLKLENRWIFPTDPSLKPPFGGTPKNLVMKFGVGKLESWGYQMVKKSCR